MKALNSRAAMWLRDHASLVWAFAVGGLVLALYGRSIDYGFMGDDPSGYFRWTESSSWTGLFTSSPGFFLRPLVFVIIKLLRLSLGGYVAPAFHLVPLILHAANAILLGVLASRLSRRPVLGWLAALLFATFPLSHEAVAQIDPLCHPLATFWILLALVFHERARRTISRRFLWAVYPCLALALLSHENGLVLPALLFVLDLLYYPPRSARDIPRRFALSYFILPVLYLLWWLQIPKGVTSAPHTLGAILRNTLPFMQAAAYPLLPLAKLSVGQWGWLLALAGLTLILTYVAAQRLRTARLWCFAVIWMAVASLPSVLFLDWDYLHGGPRLYYLASVGAALLWAAVPTAAGSLRLGAARRLAGIALAALMVLPPIPFIGCQMDLFDQATRLVRLVSAQASSAPEGRELVFANLPVFFISNAQHPAGCPSTYPFVTTGVGVFLQYADLRDFIRVNGGPDRSARGVTVAAYDSNWPPRYGDALSLSEMRDTLLQDQVYVFEIGAWSLFDLSAAWQPDAPQVQAPLAVFSDTLVLEGSSVRQSESELVVTLQWRIRSVPTQPLAAFVHVYDRDGKLVAQHDGLPGQNGASVDYVPLELWQAGDRIRDVHTIPLGSPLPAGHTVAAGLYDLATVRRLPAHTPEGAALRDDLYVIQ